MIVPDDIFAGLIGEDVVVDRLQLEVRPRSWSINIRASVLLGMSRASAACEAARCEAQRDSPMVSKFRFMMSQNSSALIKPYSTKGVAAVRFPAHVRAA